MCGKEQALDSGRQPKRSARCAHHACKFSPKVGASLTPKWPPPPSSFCAQLPRPGALPTQAALTASRRTTSRASALPDPQPARLFGAARRSLRLVCGAGAVRRWHAGRFAHAALRSVAGLCAGSMWPSSVTGDARTTRRRRQSARRTESASAPRPSCEAVSAAKLPAPLTSRLCGRRTSAQVGTQGSTSRSTGAHTTLMSQAVLEECAPCLVSPGRAWGSGEAPQKTSAEGTRHAEASGV